MKHDYIETHLAKHEYIEGPQATETSSGWLGLFFRPKRQLYRRRRSQKKRDEIRRNSDKAKA
jgi:hypothetical protein